MASRVEAARRALLEALGYKVEGEMRKTPARMARLYRSEVRAPHKTVRLDALNALAESTLTRTGLSVPEGHYADESMKRTIVPNRNMVMLALAAAHAINIKAGKLFYAPHAGDRAIYPDCRAEFVAAMAQALRLADDHAVELEAPYLNTNKAGILKRGLELGVDYSKTWTCYQGREKACGKCGACRERLEAFEKNHATDPLPYEGGLNP